MTNQPKPASKLGLYLGEIMNPMKRLVCPYCDKEIADDPYAVCCGEVGHGMPASDTKTLSADPKCFATTHKFSHCDCADESAKDAGLTFGTSHFESYVSGYDAGFNEAKKQDAATVERLRAALQELADYAHSVTGREVVYRIASEALSHGEK